MYACSIGTIVPYTYFIVLKHPFSLNSELYERFTFKVNIETIIRKTNNTINLYDSPISILDLTVSSYLDLTGHYVCHWDIRNENEDLIK